MEHLLESEANVWIMFGVSCLVSFALCVKTGQQGIVFFLCSLRFLWGSLSRATSSALAALLRLAARAGLVIKDEEAHAYVENFIARMEATAAHDLEEYHAGGKDHGSGC